MIMMSANEDGFRFEFGFASWEQANDVVAGSGADRGVAEADRRPRIRKSPGGRLEVAVDCGLQIGGRSAGGCENFFRPSARDDLCRGGAVLAPRSAPPP